MKKSLISIAALGLLSIPALASSTPVQTGKVIDSALSLELNRISGLLATRKLVADDFIDVRPMINDMVAKLDQSDPAGISEHKVLLEQIADLQAKGVKGLPVMIIDDFGDFRQSMLHVGIVSRVRVYRDAILSNKPASLQPIVDAITERQQNALPKDPRTVKDAVAAKEVANDLAKRVQNKTATKADFNVLIETIHAQRLVQFVRVTMARRQAASAVSPVDFKHTLSLITARNAAEIQLYRDAGTETQRLVAATTELQQLSMQAGTAAGPYRRHAAISTDLNLRRMMKYLEQKGTKGQQSAANFNRLRDLLSIRAAGPLGRTNTGKELTKAITAEVGKLEQIAATRKLTKDDFVSMERFRHALLTSAAEASLKK
jgi:hypothetical protein